MFGDFDPIVRTFEPGRTIKLWSVSDVHIGSRECDLEGFARFVKMVEEDPDSYVVLCGDIINNGVKDSLTNVYEEVMPPHAQVDTAVEMLNNLAEKSKILSVVGGNHEARSRKSVDLDPMYQICCLLRIPELYRQNMAFLRVRMVNAGVIQTYNILTMHGKSAAKKRRFAYALEGVDALITGHTHEGMAEKPARLVFTQKGNVVVRSLISVTATSWLKYGGYGASSMYLPQTTGNPPCLELEWTNSRNRDGKIRLLW